jgi:hypothetical protein
MTKQKPQHPLGLFLFTGIAAPSERGMRSVAQGRFAAVFAGAKEHLAGFCYGVFYG